MNAIKLAIGAFSIWFFLVGLMNVAVGIQNPPDVPLSSTIFLLIILFTLFTFWRGAQKLKELEKWDD